MIKQIIVFVAVVFSSCNGLVATCFGQNQWGNEWIDYNAQYWTFPIASDGVYRLSHSVLQNAGVPVTTIHPDEFQLYAKGRQQFIRVAHGNDASFDPGDYIEFLATKNDAWLDSLTYTSPQFVCNPRYSLFNDTLHYFLTYRPGAQGLRCNDFSDQNYQAFEPISHCRVRAEKDFHQRYLIGRQDQNGISLPTYDEGEGWFAQPFAKGQSHSWDLSTPNTYTGSDAAPARFTCISAGASMAAGTPNHHLQIGLGNPFQLMLDTVFTGYQLNRLSFDLPQNQLSAITRITHRSIDDLGVVVDLQAVSYLSIDYPSLFTFNPNGLVRFWVENPTNSSLAYVVIQGLSEDAMLYVMQQGMRFLVSTTYQNGQLHAILPLSANPQTECLLVAPGSIVMVQNIRPVSTSGYFTNYQAASLENAMILLTHSKLWPAAQNYSLYRNTQGTPTLLVDVEELYYQYGGGVRKHPLAIRRFCNHLLQTWQSPPAHLFIVGKSIHEATISSTIGARNDPEKYARNLVPTWGYQGSDLVFTAGLQGTLNQPAIPTGRLSAQNIQQVQEYLNKVVEFESAPPAAWQKNMLHFGGGGNAFEQGLFRNYLTNYAAIAADTSYGARIYSFYKNTLDPIQLNVSDTIQQLINEGVAIMNFFGHASSSGFDQNIDSPQSYTNQGKYPLLIGNSCYTGNIHLSDALSASENFVLVPNRGVIGFLAKSDLGIPSYLNMFTDNFYRHLFKLSYGESIGFCMKKSIEAFQQPSDFYRTNTALTFALHGDPSLRLYPWGKPDYRTSAASIVFDPPQVSSADQSFQMKIVLDNIGKAINKQVGVEVIRHYPDGTDTSYVFTLNRIIRSDTLDIELETNSIRGVGVNTFDVFIDYPADLVDELNNTSNNIVMGKSLLITSGDLLPVYPYEFSIINDNRPVLRASAGYALEPLKRYVLQADTTDLFNSPGLSQTVIEQAGGVVNWELPWALPDSTVVFWRCSPDSVSPQSGYRWRTSSFEYIADRTGWGQSHFYQFEKNRTTNLQHDRDSRTWDFSPTQVNMKCEVYGAANTTYESLATRYQLNLNVQDYGGYGFSTPALMVAVLDSSTFIPWESNYNESNPQNNFGNTMVSANARGRSERYFIFQQNSAQQLEGFVDMISNRIPDGNYLLIYTWLFAQKQNWQNLYPQVETLFSDLGAQAIVAAPDSVPFILFMKVGDPQSLQVVVGNQPGDDLVLERMLTGSYGSATIRGPIAGPGTNWERIDWMLGAMEQMPGDSTRIRLHGLEWNGNSTLLADWTELPNQHTDLSEVSGIQQFPFLQLEARVNDLVNYTAPQLQKWRIVYQPEPEFALNPARGFYLNKDTLQEGETLRFAVAIENISEVSGDSLKVQYYIENSAVGRRDIAQSKRKPLLPGEWLLDTLSIPTIGLGGRNTLVVNVNPKHPITKQPDQPEQYDFNNSLQLGFVVNVDRTHPVLDVTADGRHILNGEIISANPLFNITVDDENPYFIMNEEADTSRVKVYITCPDGSQRLLTYASGDLQWTPASAPKNKFKVEYNPRFVADGKYKLRVQATDKRGNNSGYYDYEITFEIVNKQGISEVLNYPNPFSTKTQFVFTLTGSEVPDEMKIQIMTISGKIVREITQDELGPLYIGRNITSYAWDGTDEYGDRLANGVYLYRVSARLNQQNLTINASEADQYITKGFGKMYLFR